MNTCRLPLGLMRDLSGASHFPKCAHIVSFRIKLRIHLRALSHKNRKGLDKQALNLYDLYESYNGTIIGGNWRKWEKQ
jgi:hypothetical protein